MKTNDIERAVDTVLSGLTVTPDQQEELIRRAMDDSQRLSLWESCPRKRTERAAPVKLKFRFSLSFGLSHMIIAAIVVVIVMVAPLFVPSKPADYTTWQSEDGEHYMIQSDGKKQGGSAEADNIPTEYGMFKCASLEEVRQYYGTYPPLITWLPEDMEPLQYTVGTSSMSRNFCASYMRNESVTVYTVLENYDGFSYGYIEQDGEGEYITLSNGKEVYITTNMGYLTVCWTEQNMEIMLSGILTRDEAIRMAESIQVK